MNSGLVKCRVKDIDGIYSHFSGLTGTCSLEEYDTCGMVDVYFDAESKEQISKKWISTCKKDGYDPYEFVFMKEDVELI